MWTWDWNGTRSDGAFWQRRLSPGTVLDFNAGQFSQWTDFHDKSMLVPGQWAKSRQKSKGLEWPTSPALTKSVDVRTLDSGTPT